MGGRWWRAGLSAVLAARACTYYKFIEVGYVNYRRTINSRQIKLLSFYILQGFKKLLRGCSLAHCRKKAIISGKAAIDMPRSDSPGAGFWLYSIVLTEFYLLGEKADCQWSRPSSVKTSSHERGMKALLVWSVCLDENRLSAFYLKGRHLAFPAFCNVQGGQLGRMTGWCLFRPVVEWPVVATQGAPTI